MLDKSERVETSTINTGGMALKNHCHSGFNCPSKWLCGEYVVDVANIWRYKIHSSTQMPDKSEQVETSTNNNWWDGSNESLPLWF